MNGRAMATPPRWTNACLPGHGRNAYVLLQARGLDELEIAAALGEVLETVVFVAYAKLNEPSTKLDSKAL